MVERKNAKNEKERRLLEQLGYRINEKIQERGLTRESLAKSTGLSVGTIASLENGNTDPRYLTLQRISNAFGIRLIDLINPTEITFALDESTVQILENLIYFVDDTHERFYSENRRFQVLARIRKVLREQLFDQFPTGPPCKSLVTAIINATNRTTAKNFRKKYLNIFKDSLSALRDGQADPETMINLEKRLLEIDDELHTKAIPRHHYSD
jgi:transcriptional regulator with XRE-family HTH domain